MIANRVAQTFSLERREAERLLTLIVSSFFLGIGLVSFYVASGAIFFTEFETDTLPYVYIVNACIVIVAGFIYSAVEKRVTFVRLLYGFTAGLALTVLLFWIGIRISHTPVVVFVMMTWFRLLFIYTNLGLWELAARMFDVRQAKRLFALSMLGATSALIIGGLSSNLVIPFIGTENLLLVSAVAFIIYIASLIIMLPRLELSTLERRNGAEPYPLREMLSDRFVVLIFIIKILGVFITFLIEFLFFQQATAQFGDQESLAVFFGTFLGASTFGMVVSVLFFSGQYTSKVGIRLALPTYPVVVLIASTITAIYGSFIGAGKVFFGLITALTYLDQVVEKSLFIPVSAILYQPLPRAKRMAVRVAADGWLGSIALMMSGLLLLAYSRLPDVTSAGFTYLVVVVALAFTICTIVIYRYYTKQLQRAVTSRFVTGVAIRPEEIRLPAGNVKEMHPSTAIATMIYLDQVGENPLDPFIIELLDHPSPHVQIGALQRIEARQHGQGLEKIKRLMNDSRLPDDVRAAALITCASLGDRESVATLDPITPTLREGALVAFLQYGNHMEQQDAARQVTLMTNSEHKADRITAAQILGRTQRGDFHEAVGKLLLDDDPDVRHAGIEAARGRPHPDHIPILIDYLQHRTRAPAMTALVEAGDDALPVIEGRFYQAPYATQVSLLRICGAMGAGNAVSFLETCLQRARRGVVYRETLSALAACRYKGDRESIVAMIRQEGANVAQILAHMQDIPADVELMHRALAHELDNSKRHILLLLSFIYDSEVLLNVQRSLQHPSEERRGNAVELLDVTISKDLKDFVLPLFEESSLADQLKKLHVLAQYQRSSVLECLQQISRQSADGWASAWTKTCAQYTLGLMSDTPVEDEGSSMLTMIDKVMFLRDVSIFSQTPDEILAEIATILYQEEFKAGETIIQKGDLGFTMYIVVRGAARVHTENRTIRELSDHDIFGELAVLDSEPRSASVVAITDTELLCLEQQDLYDLMQQRSEVIQGIMQVLTGYVRNQTNAWEQLDGV